jgi:hypothetical protein
MKSIFLIVWMCTCIHKTDNGRVYRLQGLCSEGHFESDYSRKFESFIGRWVCDSTIVDTVWLKPKDYIKD